MLLKDPVEFIDKVAGSLGEHFEHVQVLVSWNENGLTKSIHRGLGNWYARQGMAHEFIQKDIAQENAAQIAEQINPPDDGEDWKKEPSK